MNEEIIWTARPVIRDLFLNPFLLIIWIFLALTLIGLVVPLFAILRRLTTRYTLTNQRLIKESGIISKHQDDIELYRVRDTKFSQGVIARFLGIGSIDVNTTDLSGNWKLKSIANSRKVRETIRTAAESLKTSSNQNFRINTA